MLFVALTPQGKLLEIRKEWQDRISHFTLVNK